MGGFGRLFGGSDRNDAPRDGEVVRISVRAIDLSALRRVARGHEARLGSAVANTLACLRDLVAEFPPAHTANATGWNPDPYLRAFFASPDDIGLVPSRSTELGAFFEQPPGAQDACAVRGMGMNERKALGVALEGDGTRPDVAQTTLSFCDHQIRTCGASDADLRQEIVRRMVDQLAIEGISRIGAHSARRDVLGGGACAAGDPAAAARTPRHLDEIGARRRQRSRCRRTGAPARSPGGERPATEEPGAAIGVAEPQLGGMCEVFADAGKLIHVTTRRLRLSPMNVVLPPQGADEGCVLDLEIARGRAIRRASVHSRWFGWRAGMCPNPGICWTKPGCCGSKGPHEQ
ncbi:hypothetical protein QTI66_38225 [Variovorax sp. J22R133]|uniref:hypothetical protein n=1 Tax=Variovorax brevis TaxID=3053503 RepID=UPI002575A8D9|nr:hypothetical protein [Variovorax sp. J22R133]MDM0117929.1 hypothetical protein [Variovorax sp. J22R133]